MPILLPNKYATYELSDQELGFAAATISELTACWLQNLLVAAHETRLALPFDPEHPQRFVQEEAYLRGQEDTLETILSAVPPEVRFAFSNFPTKE